MAKPGFHQLYSLQEALGLLINLAPEANESCIAVQDSLGCILSRDVLSPIAIPSFAKSAMDGYAVIAEDTFQASLNRPVKLSFAGEILPACPSDRKLNHGECMEIATGAPIPEGADGIVMVEHSERENQTVFLFKPAVPGEHIISPGSDVSENQCILNQGTRLEPRHTALLSGLGMMEIHVFSPLLAGVCSSGNEIVRPPAQLEQGQSYDINSRALIDVLRSYGCNTKDFGVVSDDLDTMIKTFQEMARSCDLIIISGGSSLGTKDLMVEAIQKIGKIHVHGIAVKPGKPTLIGTIENKIFLGLPGHPTSALSNFYILIEPFLNHIYKVKKTLKPIMHARLTSKVASTIGRLEYLPVKIEQKEEEYFAKPIMRGSSAISSLVLADGYIEIHENIEVLDKETLVKVVLFT